jgi:hypothetical protein
LFEEGRVRREPEAVFYIMGGVMAATFLVSILWLPRGRLEPVEEREIVDPGLPRGRAEPVEEREIVDLGPAAELDRIGLARARRSFNR